MICWEGRSAGGLRIPIELPVLDPESAIDRSWEIPPGRFLFEPKRAYLGTVPDKLDSLRNRLALPWYWYWHPGEHQMPLSPTFILPSI